MGQKCSRRRMKFVMVMRYLLSLRRLLLVSCVLLHSQVFSPAMFVSHSTAISASSPPSPHTRFFPRPVALRNRIDYSLVSTLIEKSDLIPRKFTEPKQLFTGRDESLPDDILVKVGSKLNITPRQVSTAFDIWKLGELEKAIRDIVAKASTLSGAKVNESIASLEASYKVMLKRSLLKLIRERKDEDDDEVSFGSMSRGEQLDHLEGCFNATIVRYRSILK